MMRSATVSFWSCGAPGGVVANFKPRGFALSHEKG